MIVRQAANVLDLLEFFVRRKEPATLSAIADALGWPRSSTFNLIQTLVDRGYLYEPRPRSGYYPSPRWFSVAQHVAAAEPLPEFVHALVGELSAETGETAAIGAPAGINAIFVDVQESPAAVRYFAQVGSLVSRRADLCRTLSEVADGPRSVIREQVNNGVAVRMAVLASIAATLTRHRRPL